MSRYLIMLFAVVSATWFVCVNNNALSVTPADLVAYWSFDKGSGQIVSDDSGNKHEGNIKNAVWLKEGKFKGAMVFDGKGAFVEVASKPELDPGKDNWTIELWMKRADNGTDWQKILTKYPCCNWNGYRVGLLNSNVHVIFGTGPAPDNVEFTSAAQILDMEWHHLALVVDRKSDAVIYIDGQPDANKMSVKHIGEIATTQNLEIGRCHWCGGGMTMGFNGTLDEIKIWRAALTEEEIGMAMSGKLGAAVSLKGALPITWGNIKAGY